MLIASIENKIEGLFTSVFDLYREKVDYVTSDYALQPSFDTEIRIIHTDVEKADRIKKAILSHAGKYGFNEIMNAYRSCNKNKENIIFRYIMLMFERKDSIKNLANSDVIAFNDICSKVYHEVHRLHGFLRFQKSKMGIYYAKVEPDNDVLELLMPHFCSRYRDMMFLIYDSRRNLVGIFDRIKYAVFQSKEPLTVILDEEELAFQRLFKLYYKKISILERKNLRQMKQYMPKRYHKNMLEKDELL